MNARPPPRGAPPPYAIMNRVSGGRNLRPVVLIFAFLSALWTLFSAIGNFRSISIDRGQNESKLATFSLVLGILSISAFAIEAFGVVAALSQRIPLMRIYSLLSAVVILIVVGGGLLEVIIHFTMKNDIIGECTNLVTGDDVAFYPFGFWGPISHTVINAEDARDWCQSAWDHDSWADIVELLILIFLSGLFAVTAYGYYRQLLDPTSPANVSRGPVRNNTAFPSHYNPPYDATIPSLGYQYNPPYGQPPYGAYAPPPGPPPDHEGANGKPPGYIGGDGLAGAGYAVDAKEKENPFADFDEPAGTASIERDVTSRPGPGGRETFN